MLSQVSYNFLPSFQKESYKKNALQCYQKTNIWVFGSCLKNVEKLNGGIERFQNLKSFFSWWGAKGKDDVT